MIDDKKLKMKWHNSLYFQVPLVFLLLFLILSGSVFIMTKTVAQKRLRTQAQQQIILSGRNLISEITNLLCSAENLAGTFSDLGRNLPKDAQLYNNLFPAMFNPVGSKSFISGGGIWFEPYKFSVDVECSSFFWAYNRKGILQRYDSCNASDGREFYNQHWYIPARYIADGDSFWSKSYISAYSHQPVVTCTVPLYRDNQFYGISAVDLKVEAIDDLMHRNSSEFGGYSFLIDYSGRFLSFPACKLVRNYSADAAGNKAEEFITLKELAEKETLYAPFFSMVSEIDSELKTLAAESRDYSPEFAERLFAQSPRIDVSDAEIVSGILADSFSDYGLSKPYLRKFTVANDLLTAQQCVVFVFHMPGTYWKLISVMPASRIYATAGAIYTRILFVFLVVLFLLMILGFFVIRGFILCPLRSIFSSLKRDALNNFQGFTPIEIGGNNEFGCLAYLFNLRGSQLADSVCRLNKIRSELEERISSCTEELSQLSNDLHHQTSKRNESQKMLYMIMDNIPQSVFWKDRNSVYLGCNWNFAKIANIGSPENVVGKTDYELAWGKENSDFFVKCDKEVITSDEPKYHIVEPYRRIDGSQGWFEANKIPLHNEQGKIIGVLGTLEDITERKAVYEKIAKSRQTLQTMIDSMPFGVMVVDKTKKIRLINRKATALAGYNCDDELLGNICHKFVCPAEVGCCPVLDEHNAIDNSERILLTKDGRKLPIIKSAVPIIFDEEEVLLEAFIDITASKQAQQRYRLIFENVNDSILLMSNGRFIDCNPRTLEMFGCSREQMVGQTLYRFSPAVQPNGRDSMALALEYINASLSGKPQKFKWTHCRYDGTEFFTEVSLTSFEMDDSICILGIVSEC